MNMNRTDSFQMSSMSSCGLGSSLTAHAQSQELAEETQEETSFEADQCEEGWKFFKHTKNCYKYYSEYVTPIDASIHCKKNRGLLASIHDILTNNFISNITSDNPVWIGGFKQNGWTWEDGSLWDYSNWGPNEPNNQGGDEAYVMTNWGGRGLWNDAHKGYQFHFVCQSNEIGVSQEPPLEGATWYTGEEDERGSKCDSPRKGEIQDV